MPRSCLRGVAQPRNGCTTGNADARADAAGRQGRDWTAAQGPPHAWQLLGGDQGPRAQGAQLLSTALGVSLLERGGAWTRSIHAKK